jgi:hypothetical protein
MQGVGWDEKGADAAGKRILPRLIIFTSGINQPDDWILCVEVAAAR